MPGKTGASPRATRASWRRSPSRASPAPGYCTFTATSRPSCHRPLCTCPIDAAAAGPPSSQTSRSRQSSPRPRAIWSRTVCVGIGGAESWSAVRWARYGAATSSGNAASSTDSAWPNFIAPPLSSPSVRKSCSAVRCCISVITTSPGRPASRLPSPIALRPAYPSGSAASRAVRATVLRGRSAMPSVSQVPKPAPASSRKRSTPPSARRWSSSGARRHRDHPRWSDRGRASRTAEIWSELCGP